MMAAVTKDVTNKTHVARLRKIASGIARGICTMDDVEAIKKAADAFEVLLRETTKAAKQKPA